MKMRSRKSTRRMGTLLTMCIVGILTAVAVFPSVSSADTDKWSNMLINAYDKNLPLPVISTLHPDLYLEEAYDIAKPYVLHQLQKNRDKIIGYKAGIVSWDAMKNNNMIEPLLGVLFESLKKDDGCTLYSKDFRRLVIETEVAFVVGKPITKPMANLAELKEYLAAVAPGIDAADLRMWPGVPDKILDVIATNGNAGVTIIGKQWKMNEIDYVNIEPITLTHNGKIVSTGKAKNAFNDPLVAMYWSVNRAIKNGYTFNTGDVVLTGNLGTPYDAAPGDYVADWGKFGKISWTVK